MDEWHEKFVNRLNRFTLNIVQPLVDAAEPRITNENRTLTQTFELLVIDVLFIIIWAIKAFEILVIDALFIIIWAIKTFELLVLDALLIIIWAINFLFLCLYIIFIYIPITITYASRIMLRFWEIFWWCWGNIWGDDCIELDWHVVVHGNVDETIRDSRGLARGAGY